MRKDEHSMIQAYQKFWMGAFNFRERTVRSDFWSAIFVHLIVLIIPLNVHHYLTTHSYLGYSLVWESLASLSLLIFWGYALAAILPYFAMTIRRLRDAALPWELIFLTLVFGVGSVILLILNGLPQDARARHLPIYQPLNVSSDQLAEEPQNFSKAFNLYFKNYFDFSGRLNRKAFWLVQLVWVLILTCFIVLAKLLEPLNQFGLVNVAMFLQGLFTLFLVTTAIPQIASFTRRLRDVGLSNLNILIVLSTTVIGTAYYWILNHKISLSYATNQDLLLQYLLFLVLMLIILCLIILLSLPKQAISEK